MSKKLELLKANETALRYFCLSFDASENAKKYLFNRLSKKTIKKFYLGYAPKQGLTHFLKKKDIKLETAVEAGLLNLNEDGSPYEILTNRIIFPIPYNGRVVGFGGRTMIDHNIKYLNSKTTPLYNKGATLYLLDYAKQHINKLGYVIVVEGYFDVLALIENDIPNVVGICGSACRKDHALILRRWTDDVYTCFDGDEAGRKGQERAAKILNSFSLFGGNMQLLEGYDPYDFIREFGKEKFLALRNV